MEKSDNKNLIKNLFEYEKMKEEEEKVKEK